MDNAKKIHELEMKLIHLTSKYIRLFAVASEHATECDAAGSLRYMLKNLEKEVEA